MELSHIRETIDETLRKVAAITVQRGLELALPIRLPCQSVDDVSTLSTWLEEADNCVDFVSYSILNYVLWFYTIM